jgi:hypothetical protein
MIGQRRIEQMTLSDAIVKQKEGKTLNLFEARALLKSKTDEPEPAAGSAEGPGAKKKRSAKKTKRRAE